jgi:ABC-type glycerol-3-phosphate transport system substrate-binding protein
VLINNELTRRALAFYASLLNEHRLAPSTLAQRETDAFDGVELFKQQKIVFFVGRTYMLAEFEKITDFNWDIAPVPKGPKRLQPGMPAPGSMEPPQPVEVWPRYSRLAVGGNCIWANSPQFKEAWEFVKFYSSEKAQRILARGRNAVPAYKTVAESAEFLRKPPENIDVLISSRAYSHMDNIHNLTFWDEFNHRCFTEITDQLLLGKLTVDEAVEQMEKVGRELFEQAKKKR